MKLFARSTSNRCTFSSGRSRQRPGAQGRTTTSCPSRKRQAALARTAGPVVAVDSLEQSALYWNQSLLPSRCHYVAYRWHRLSSRRTEWWRTALVQAHARRLRQLRQRNLEPSSQHPSRLNYAPLFFGSQVIADGRLTVIGGEVNLNNYAWTTQGAIYDPVADTWTNVPPPSGWQRTGDAQATNLPDGTYMQASCCDQPPKWAYLNPTNLTWTNFQGNGKFDVFDEEGWNLLPNGKLLTVDAYVFQYDATGMNSELYDPSSQTWSSAGSTVVQLWDSLAEFRATAQPMRWARRCYVQMVRCLLPAQPTAAPPVTPRFTTATPAPGPLDPISRSSNVSIADGPAALETNGKVLMMGSVNEGPPATFFEWDGTNLTAIPGPPNAPNAGSFYGHLLPLPSWADPVH